MNPPVHCIHCGTLQNWDNSNWGVGPDSIRVSFMCPGCGWFVEAKAMTWDFLMSQMEDQ